jgi:hypothetical protein
MATHLTRRQAGSAAPASILFDFGFNLEFDSVTSPDSHIPRRCVWGNLGRGRLNTSKSGTIVIAATNGLAWGRRDDIHASASI